MRASTVNLEFFLSSPRVLQDVHFPPVEKFQTSRGEDHWRFGTNSARPLADLSLARTVQGRLLSRGLRNARAKALIMRASSRRTRAKETNGACLISPVRVICVKAARVLSGLN